MLFNSSKSMVLTGFAKKRQSHKWNRRLQLAILSCFLILRAKKVFIFFSPRSYNALVGATGSVEGNYHRQRLS